MRTIKFRVWDKYREKMFYNGFELRVINFSYIWQTIAKPNKPSLEVMQFTGLIDKNGIEVFEGDIVFHEDGEFSWYGIVRWDEHDLYFYADLYHTNEFLQTEFVEAQLEVIGNIYENPELIK